MIEAYQVEAACEDLRYLMRNGDEDTVTQLIGHLVLERIKMNSARNKETRRKQELKDNLVVLSGGRA